MPVFQPSLWDNVALENGLHSLATLDFDNAFIQLNEALGAPGDRKVTQQAIEACQFWQPLASTNPSVLTIKILLSHFASYSFIPPLAGLKKALIVFIADCISKEEQIDLQNAITSFDLLLACENFQAAEKLIFLAVKQYPEKYDLLYLLAQAQWKNGHTREANNSYVRALLYHPDATMLRRIENSRLSEMVELHGPCMAPAFGWIERVLPLAPLADEIKYRGEAHQKAIHAYRLLKQSEKSLKNNDLKASIPLRKELKLTAPDLYEAYFRRLK